MDTSRVIEFLTNKEIVISLFTVVFAVIYAYAAAYFLSRLRKRRKETVNTFFAAISEGLKDGTLESLEDFINIYKGVHGLSSDDTSYRSGLVRRLRGFMVDLVLKKMDIKEPDRITAVKEKLTKFISEMEKSEPFASLPNAERTLLSDVSRMIELGDKRGANQKLEDIAGLIEARQDNIDHVEKLNKWAIPLAAVGLILTIVFGVISIFK